MKSISFAFAHLLSLGAPLATATAGGSYYDLTYPASTNAGELRMDVIYRLWVPEGVRHIRSVIVHQHGCGTPACDGGKTAADDLHWQALARKWDSALLGPSYRQAENVDCQLWSNPKNGSEKTFLRALADFAEKTGHRELAAAPWCLWGHSGGGFWAGEMTLLHPHRIIAVWQRSGASGFFRQERSGLPADDIITPSVLEVPVVCNPGIKEKDDRFARIWNGMNAMFAYHRSKGAPIVFAPDPRTSHECGDSRYLAVPFFDACLQMRLPAKGKTLLRPVDLSRAWYSPIPGTNAVPSASFTGDLTTATWLPNAKFAAKWMEYVTTGTVSDSTPPPKPFQIKTRKLAEGGTEITWDAHADFESGIGAFVVLRDGRKIGVVPTTPIQSFGKPLFQGKSYHDTPLESLTVMRFLDTNAPAGRSLYKVISVNSVGLRSP